MTPDIQQEIEDFGRRLLDECGKLGFVQEYSQAFELYKSENYRLISEWMLKFNTEIVVNRFPEVVAHIGMTIALLKEAIALDEIARYEDAFTALHEAVRSLDYIVANAKEFIEQRDDQTRFTAEMDSASSRASVSNQKAIEKRNESILAVLRSVCEVSGKARFSTQADVLDCIVKPAGSEARGGVKDPTDPIRSFRVQLDVNHEFRAEVEKITGVKF